MGKENHRSHRRRRKNDETRNERCIKRYKLEDLKLIMKKKSSREKEREKWKNTRRSSSITDKRVFLLIQNTKEFKRERKQADRHTQCLDLYQLFPIIAWKSKIQSS